ncbi:hypothetical protein E8L99_12610 [Phreatobacter aquaticus]|uniref:Bacteriocin-protection protein n=1 Tax=Phreatobacter aquaticus TaxID=2570229 RepID=A0A4D7QGY3_9HYPH|nr:YdeI/OmpD-associated family protein [Phreatobacter aquaticus]QCK86538.1 hypothetical protein E8L99_12610 [Phreatobacter aquaticus]
MAAADLPVLTFSDAATFDAWLDSGGASSSGCWLVFAKKGSGGVTLSRDEAVDIALCHGWIDGQAKPIDDKAWRVRFTPRRPRSIWAALNRDRVERLFADGRMKPAGLAEVEAAKADGRWAIAYEPPSRMAVPDDLQRALDDNPPAKALFGALDSANRYAVLHRVTAAKKPETRTSWIVKLVAMLARGETIHPRRKKSRH